MTGDFTGDGKLDLAVADALGIQLLLGNGDGTFQPAQTVAKGSFTCSHTSLVAGDFTGDGKLDLAVSIPTSSHQTVSVLLGNGNGTFQPQVNYPAGGIPEAMVVGDFTADGRLDIAVAIENPNNQEGAVSVLLGNGDGTFQPPQVSDAVGEFPEAIVAGDFTGDGRLDVAISVDNIAESGTVSVLLGNGDGTFQRPVDYAVGVLPIAMVAGDFTGNGKLDIAVACQDGGSSLLLGNGDGTFQPQVTFDAGTQLVRLVAGDFNGDGMLDLVATTYDTATGAWVYMLLNEGGGNLQPQVQSGTEVTAESGPIVAGDFTGDGQLDLAIGTIASDTISILLGNGDGTFQPAVTYTVGDGPTSIVAGDFNGDGRLDLAVKNSEDYTVSVLLGNGDGTFQPQVTYAAGFNPGILAVNPSGIVAGDFTGDGKLDLAVTNYYNNTVSVLMGNGDGTFQPQVAYPTGLAPSGIVAGDFTGRGVFDLAVTNSGSNTVSVLLGNGDGTFQPQVTYATGSSGGSQNLQDIQDIVAGDFTGDGHLDLAVVNEYSDDVSVLLGNGDGTFQPQVTYAVGSNPTSIVAADFTGDGKLDLAVANSGSNTVSVLLGNGDGTFQPQVTYPTSYNPSGLVVGDFTGGDKFDLAVVNQSPGSLSVLLSNSDGSFTTSGQADLTSRSSPLVADVTGDGTDDVLVVDGSGNILYRQGIPGEPGSFLPPVTVNSGYPSRDIAWLPDTNIGPVLASVDAEDNAISFYAYRDGRFVRLNGSLSTGQFPAQIIAAQLDGNGLDDLVVRNAGDGTLSVYLGSLSSGVPGPPARLIARASRRPSSYRSAWASPTSRRSIPRATACSTSSSPTS